MFIFSMLQWRTNNDGTFRLDTHLVAAETSADAEDKFFAQDRNKLRGFFYVNSDRFMADRGDCVRMYTTRYTNEDAVSLADYNAWIERSINDMNCDGEMLPAPFCFVRHVK
jgi:hypothetical protein